MRRAGLSHEEKRAIASSDETKLAALPNISAQQGRMLAATYRHTKAADEISTAVERRAKPRTITR